MYPHFVTSNAAAQQDCEDASGLSSSEYEPAEIRARSAVVAAATTGVLALLALALLAAPVYWSATRQQVQVPAAAQINEVQELDGFHFGQSPGSLPLHGGSLKPVENMHDGNVCEDDEELYEKLCYKKCSLLTSGEFNLRTSPFSCCSGHPCGFANQKIMMRTPCNGYDIGGDAIGGGCPHEPGACLEDEELNLGVCYKKCSLLTNGEYPHRIAAATCCKKEGIFCLNIFWDKTSAAFAVGGGAGDKDKSTPADPHMPLESLTEKTN